jgi:hypothetical protein
MDKHERTFRTSLMILGAGLLALLATESTRSDEKATDPAKPAFKVYGGQCTRSWRLLGTYDNAHNACKAARKFRTEDKMRAEVTTGNGVGSILGGTPTSYSVYQRGIRCGNWLLHSTVDSRQKAEEIMKGFNKDLQPTELVYHFAPAK